MAILRLLVRRHERHHIAIDGVDVKTLDTGDYRRHAGMVLQDPYPFHGTVLEK